MYSSFKQIAVALGVTRNRVMCGTKLTGSVAETTRTGSGSFSEVDFWDHEPPDPHHVFVNLNPFQQPHGEDRAEWNRPLPGGQ